MYRYVTHVRMQDTDAAGVIYFTNQFRMAQEGFEHFLDSVGYSVGHMLANTDYLTPVVHAEADYREPLRVGDRLVFDLTLERIGTKSFTLCSDVSNDEGHRVGRVRIVHAAVSKATWRACPLPDELRGLLETHLRPNP